MSSARFYEQRERLALRLDEVIRASLSDDGVPPVSDAIEEVYGRYSIGKHTEQWEMRFFLHDLRAFTPGLVNRMRALVRQEFRKWSVVPQFDSHSFTVASDSVRFKRTVIEEPITDSNPAFKRWLSAARSYEKKRYGPIRQQLRHIRPLLPAAVRTALEVGLVVVAAFDFYSPHLWKGGPVVWVVLGPDLEEAKLVKGNRLRLLPVSASSFLFPDYTGDFARFSDDLPVALLGTFEFVLADRETLTLVPPGRAAIPLPIDRILSVSDLTKRGPT